MVRSVLLPSAITLIALLLLGATPKVAWLDGRHGNREIYHRDSPDAGSTFGPEQRLTFDAGASLRASIAAFRRQVHVLWADDQDSEQRIGYRKGLSPHATERE